MVTEDQGTSMAGGRYALERKLGRGGVGEVYLALDSQLNRWVAIKRLHAGSLAAGERAASAIAEARHLASLQHPNIVTVFDFVEHGEDVMVVMEFLHGQTLEELEAPLPFEDFVEMARQSLEGLGAAHRMEMIHRDIKPGNIMLAALPSGKYQVKILDFGLAKIIDCPSPQTMDHTGALLGSVYTMTPEQLDQRPLDHRSDLYSLGCAFYYSLTLQYPFDGETIVAVMAAHLQHSVRPLQTLRPDLPPRLCEWVENLFALEVAARPADAGSAAAQLKAIAAGDPANKRIAGRPLLSVASRQAKKKRNGLWVAGFCLVLAALAAALVVNLKERPEQDAIKVVEVPSATPVETADAIDAGNRDQLLTLLGKSAIVEGTISRAGVNKPGTIRYLNFQGGSRSDLSLVFFAREGDFSAEQLEAYVGKKVRVSGIVTAYQGNPQIEIRNWSQIQVQ